MAATAAILKTYNRISSRYIRRTDMIFALSYSVDVVGPERMNLLDFQYGCHVETLFIETTPEQVVFTRDLHYFNLYMM